MLSTLSRFLLLVGSILANPTGSPLCGMSSSLLVGSPHTLTASPGTYSLNFSYVSSHNVYLATIQGPPFVGLQLTVQKDGVSVGQWTPSINKKFATSSTCPTYMTHKNSDPTTSTSTSFLWKPTNNLLKGDVIQPSLWVAVSQASIYSVAATQVILSVDGSGQGDSVKIDTRQLLIIVLGFLSVLTLHGLLSLLEYLMNKPRSKKKQAAP